MPTATADDRAVRFGDNPYVDGADVMVRIRAADDLDPLVDALALVAKTDGYPSRWPDDPGSWLRTRDAHGAWVAEHNGQILGHVVLRRAGGQRPIMLWCELSGEDPASCAVMSRLFVVAHARGLGVGRALVEAACAMAADLSLRPVLDVADTGHAAVRLYQRLGWTHVGSYEERFHDGGPSELLHCFVGAVKR